MTGPDEKTIEELVEAVGKKPAYQSMHLPVATLRDLAVKALHRQPNKQMALKTVRRKMHQITAPYLGDPQYIEAEEALKTAFQAGTPAAITRCCQEILSTHTSTRERLEILSEFYPRLFSVTGKPHSVIDLACGLNPLTLRWMGLPGDSSYLAYDIHAPRVDLINSYFKLENYHGQAILQDILVDSPTMGADMAFLFKEAHRFEEREKGCNRALWRALNVKNLCVSLPPVNMTGRHDLAPRNRRLVNEIASAEGWQVTEISFTNEQVFVINKA